MNLQVPNIQFQYSQTYHHKYTSVHYSLDYYIKDKLITNFVIENKNHAVFASTWLFFPWSASAADAGNTSIGDVPMFFVIALTKVTH